MKISNAVLHDPTKKLVVDIYEKASDSMKSKGMETFVLSHDTLDLLTILHKTGIDLVMVGIMFPQVYHFFFFLENPLITFSQLTVCLYFAQPGTQNSQEVDRRIKGLERQSVNRILMVAPGAFEGNVDAAQDNAFMEVNYVPAGDLFFLIKKEDSKEKIHEQT